MEKSLFIKEGGQKRRVEGNPSYFPDLHNTSKSSICLRVDRVIKLIKPALLHARVILEWKKCVFLFLSNSNAPSLGKANEPDPKREEKGKQTGWSDARGIKIRATSLSVKFILSHSNNYSLNFPLTLERRLVHLKR